MPHLRPLIVSSSFIAAYSLFHKGKIIFNDIAGVFGLGERARGIAYGTEFRVPKDRKQEQCIRQQQDSKERSRKSMYNCTSIGNASANTSRHEAGGRAKISHSVREEGGHDLVSHFFH